MASQHINAFSVNQKSKVVAISSRKIKSAQQKARDAGLTDIGIYDNYDKALQHEGVDIVVVCTPQHVHCQNVIAAAEAGKHIVIEKPAGISMEEIRSMQEAVKKAGVKTVVSFVLRWNPLFQKIKKTIAKDGVGEVYAVETDYQSYAGDWWGGWPEGRRANWGVSALLVGGCHAVDALRWFAAQGEFEAAEPVEVFAYSGGKRGSQTRQYNPLTNSWQEGLPMEYPGLEMVLVKFSNGVLGKVSVNFDCIQPYTFPIEIFGDKGSVKNNRIWSHKYPEQKDWKTIDAISPDSSDVSHHPFQAQADHFIECLEKDIESHCNLKDAAKTHEVVFAVQECYRTGVPVKLPLV